jgi:hypothetical protein
MANFHDSERTLVRKHFENLNTKHFPRNGGKRNKKTDSNILTGYYDP